MGNVCHAGPVQGRPSRAVTLKKASDPTFGKDPSLKREDYIFSGVQDATCLVKLPGTVNGQQFLVENCANCDIFVLDHCTAVQIDECTNCRIFVGPCDSSLFVRNCTNCTVVTAVQQLRTRDCADCDVYLYCATGRESPNRRGVCLSDSFLGSSRRLSRSAHHRDIVAHALWLLSHRVLFAAAPVGRRQVFHLEQQMERGTRHH